MINAKLFKITLLASAAYMSMVPLVKTKNPYQSCSDDEQKEYQDDNRSRNNPYAFLHDHNLLQSGGPIHLTLSKTKLAREIKIRMPRKKQKKNDHQEELSQLQPPRKTGQASNVHAMLFTVGSWSWESKNLGDLVAKFYYGKKKLLWEFLFGSMKKKIEIRWSIISAINNYVDEQKNVLLQIELMDPPEYYQECRFVPGKHTQWERASDFTGGQATNCRRHAILFSPGVLNEPLKKLLQLDNRLYNLNQQRFPINNSPFFSPRLQFSNNSSVDQCSLVSHSNHVQNLVQTSTSFAGSNVATTSGLLAIPNSYEIPTEVSYVNERTYGVWEQNGNNQIEDIPFPPYKEQKHNELYEELRAIISDEQVELNHVAIENLAEVTTKITNGVWEQRGNNNQFQDVPLLPINENGDNEPPEGLQQFISDEQRELQHVANHNLTDVINGKTNGVWEKTGNNQFQDIPLPPIIMQNDDDLFEGLESIIPHEQMGLHQVENQNLAEVITTEQNCYKVDSTSKDLEQNHLNICDYFVGGTDGSCSNGGVMDHMAFVDDDDVCSFAQRQFNDEFAIQEPCLWSSSQYSRHGSNNGGNGGSSTN